MDNPFGVVKATPAYNEAIFAALKGLHAENGMWPMNEERVRLEIHRTTSGQQPAIIGLILGKENDIEGIVWLLLQDSWYSDWYSWNERLLYVMPEYRRTTHAKKLAQFTKWCSDTMSEKIKDSGEAQTEIPLIIGIMTFKALEPKMRLYQRQFHQIGATFMHRAIPPEAYNQKRLAKG